MKGHTMIKTTELRIGDFVTLEVDRNSHTPTTIMGDVVALKQSDYNPDQFDLKIRHIDTWIYGDEGVAVVARIGAPE
jgi:hypothetical protein